MYSFPGNQQTQCQHQQQTSLSLTTRQTHPHLKHKHTHLHIRKTRYMYNHTYVVNSYQHRQPFPKVILYIHSTMPHPRQPVQQISLNALL